MKTMELAPAPAVRRGKWKHPDKLIPDEVAAMFPESALYTQLLEFESRVDATLVRKKMDIMESLKNPVRVRKVLRIYVFNTFTNQTSASTEKENSELPSWSLRLVGRILEDGKDPVEEGQMKGPKCSYPKLSSFFKKITIYLDQSVYPDSHVILWESSRSPVLHEGFEVKRKGDMEFTAIIRLEKFKLSPALQEVLGIGPRIMVALWQYVKMKKLQIPGEASFFMCDPPLRKAFFLGFSQSPAEFINALISSQARDSKVASVDSGRDVENFMINRANLFHLLPLVPNLVP